MISIDEHSFLSKSWVCPWSLDTCLSLSWQVRRLWHNILLYTLYVSCLEITLSVRIVLLLCLSKWDVPGTDRSHCPRMSFITYIMYANSRQLLLVNFCYWLNLYLFKSEHNWGSTSVAILLIFALNCAVSERNWSCFLFVFCKKQNYCYISVIAGVLL